MPVPDNINEIAAIIERDWQNMYFGAVPYVEAMYSLRTVKDRYLCDSAVSVIRYFLGNAKTWRGETAREVKAKLNQLANSK